MSMIKSLSLLSLSLSLSRLGKQQRDEARTVHNLHTRKLGTNIAEVSSCIMKIIYECPPTFYKLSPHNPTPPPPSLSLSLSRKLHQSLKHDESKDLCANVGLPQFKTKTQVKLLCRLKKQNLDVFDSKATVQCQSLLQRKSLGPNISGQPTSIKQDLP